MNITSFDDLLQAARAQSEPQRLLFVFAGTLNAARGLPGYSDYMTRVRYRLLPGVW